MKKSINAINANNTAIATNIPADMRVTSSIPKTPYEFLKDLCRPDEGNFARWAKELERLGRKDIIVIYTGSNLKHGVEVYLDHKCNVMITFLHGVDALNERWSHDLILEGEFVLDPKNEGYADCIVSEWNVLTDHVHNVIQNLVGVDDDAFVKEHRRHFAD